MVTMHEIGVGCVLACGRTAPRWMRWVGVLVVWVSIVVLCSPHPHLLLCRPDEWMALLLKREARAGMTLLRV